MKESLDRLKSMWSILSWMVLALLLCAVVVGVYLYFRVDDELKFFLEKQIAKHYPQLSISIGDARLLRDEGIRIRGISMVQPGDDKQSRSEPVFIEEVFLRCRTDLPTLLNGSVDIQRVHVRGLILRGIRRADGEFNLTSLIPRNVKHKKHQRIPIVSIENATVDFIDRTTSLTKLILFRRVHAQIVPKYSPGRLSEPPRLEIETSFDHDDIQSVSIRGMVDLADGSWIASGNATGLRLTESLYRILPREVSSFRELAEPFRATSNLTFQIKSSQLSARPTVVVHGEIIDGKYTLPRHAHPITDISAKVRLENRSMQVTDLKANFGAARLKMSLQRGGYNARSPMTVDLQADNLLIDRSLVASLPQTMQETWKKFQPLGTVSGGMFLSFNGENWNYDAELKCKDIGFQYHRFQYPITRTNGRVLIKRGKLDFNLTGITGNTPITIVGSWFKPGPRATGWCRVQTQEWMSIDDHLQRAVQKTYPNASRIVQQLNPRGKINVSAMFRKDRPVLGPARPRITIAMQDGWMEYEKFPYPINEIQGTMVLDGANWQFQEFTGYNDSCMITCNGTLVPSRKSDHLQLEISANNIALDDELRTALPASMRRLWLDLKPRGSVDIAKINVRHTKGHRGPAMTITATKLPRTAGGSDRGMSVKPIWFPYRFEGISGHAEYRNGRLVVKRLVGSNKATTFKSDMLATFDKRGNWSVRLDQISASGLRTGDGELMEALPAGLVSAIHALNVQGFMAISGSMMFQGISGIDSLQSNWDIDVDLDHVKFQPGILVNNIHGAARLRGRSKPNSIVCQADLGLDSAMYQGIHFQDIRGPIFFDGSKVWGGAMIPVPGHQAKVPSIRAKVHQGTATFDFDVDLQKTPLFSINASVRNADLASFARDSIPKNRALKGRVSGNLNLTGNASGTHTLLGDGNVGISEANLYELPLILALLKRIRYGAQDAAVLTANVNFNVEGENLYFGLQKPNRPHTDAGITISGDTLTLKGNGRIGFNRDVELEFYTLMGRENLWSPVIRPIVGEASRQFLKIKVFGSLDQPVTKQDVLPGFNESIRYMFPELTDSDALSNLANPKKRFSLRRFRRK